MKSMIGKELVPTTQHLRMLSAADFSKLPTLTTPAPMRGTIAPGAVM